ncbi:MAG: hypothetical protein ACU0FH_08850 [Heliomarina sp.]|uniref:hypothetical protein n=1 Tax=Heliomarina sp. TaxID=2917556 RepID=UPI00405A43C9
MLFVIIGARGAGKTTLVDSLRERGELVLKPSTDRKPRFDGEDEYSFFDSLEGQKLSWVISVGSSRYGYLKDETDKAIESVAFAVFDPLNIDVLDKFSESAPFEVVKIGLDTI